MKSPLVQLVEDLASINHQLRLLEESKKAKTEEIKHYLKRRKDHKFDCPFGKVILKTRFTWSYSEWVEMKEKELKLQKKTEQEEGVATPTPMQYVEFRFPTLK